MQAILVVRNKTADNTDISLLLQHKELLVLNAENADEASSIFAQHPDISLILLQSDLNGINGYDATQMLRKLDSHIPIILLVNYSNFESIRLATLVGCSHLLQNPVHPETLEGMVMNLLYQGPVKSEKKILTDY